MKKRFNDSARASALQISVSVALLCFAAVLFASSFRAAAPAIATQQSVAANQPGFYPPLPNQAPNLTQYPRSQNAPEQAVGVTAPTFSMDVSDGFVVNNQTVNASTISPSLNIIGCQGDLIFDSAVALPTPMTAPVNATGLTANNWTVSGNVIQTCNGVPCPGTLRTLRISAFSNDGVTPLDGAGPLYNIKWKRVSANSGDSTTLIWGTVESGNDFELIDTDLNVISASPQTNGLITITGPTPTPGGTATPTPVPTASPTPPPTASPTPMPTEPPTPTPPPIATPTPSPTATPTPVSTATPTPGGLPKVSAPTFNMDTSDGFAVNNQPVTVTNIDPGLNYIGFQGDLIFDSAVAAPTPSTAPVGAAGLTANNWTVSGNVLNSGPGTLRTIRVSAFSNDGVTPLNGAGILFQIHWKRVSTNSGDTTPLTWSPSPNDFEFIDTDLNVFSPPQNNGMITITGATPTPGGTATPTPEPTATPTPVVTATPTTTPTPPSTATPTPEVTATPTPVVTATPTPVVTATPSPEPTATPTPVSTATPTAPPTATPTAPPTATPTVPPTATPTAPPTATPTAPPTATPTAPPTATPTATPAPTITPVPTATPQPTCKKGDIKFEGHCPTSGAPGNIRTFHKDGTFVKASGFSRDNSGTWNMSFLGLYDHGLGVTGPTEGNGDNNRFLIDNAGGSTDYVLFEFNTLINVDKVRLEKVLADSDITVWIGTTDDPFSNHNILSDAFLASLADNETNLGGHGDRDANINPGVVSGNVLVVAAKSGDTDDAFLIRKLNYDCPTTCPTITLDPPTLPDGTIGHNYNKDIHAHGGHGEDTFTLTAGSLPPGLTIDSHGHIRGEPTTEGTYSFTVTATDDRGCSGSHDYTLTIECPDIDLSPGSLPNPKKNHSYDKRIDAHGGDSPYSFDLAGGSLPPGIDLSSDGHLTGTPTALGTFTFMVEATDENGCKGSKAYSLTVTN